MSYLLAGAILVDDDRAALIREAMKRNVKVEVWDEHGSRWVPLSDLCSECKGGKDEACRECNGGGSEFNEEG